MVTIGTVCYPVQFNFTFTVIKQNTVPILRFNSATFLARKRFLTTTQVKQGSITCQFLLISFTPSQVQTRSQSEDTPMGLARNLKFKFWPN